TGAIFQIGIVKIRNEWNSSFACRRACRGQMQIVWKDSYYMRASFFKNDSTKGLHHARILPPQHPSNKTLTSFRPCHRVTDISRRWLGRIGDLLFTAWTRLPCKDHFFAAE